jgi:hypothetical protein
MCSSQGNVKRGRGRIRETVEKPPWRRDQTPSAGRAAPNRRGNSHARARRTGDAPASVSASTMRAPYRFAMPRSRSPPRAGNARNDEPPTGFTTKAPRRDDERNEGRKSNAGTAHSHAAPHTLHSEAEAPGCRWMRPNTGALHGRAFGRTNRSPVRQGGSERSDVLGFANDPNHAICAIENRAEISARVQKLLTQEDQHVAIRFALRQRDLSPDQTT